MLKVEHIYESRSVNVTVSKIRHSVETLCLEEVETNRRLRETMARSAQHSVATASKHYNFSDKEGVR